MFKLAICISQNASQQEPVLFRGNYADAFAYAAKLGVQGLEIHLRDASEVDKGLLLEQSQRTGIQVAAIATGLAKRIDGLCLIDDDPQIRAKALRRIEGHLTLAEQFGCPVILGSMRGNLPVKNREKYRRLLLDALEHLSGFMAGKSCSIVLEAINRYENNYLNTVEETLEFLRKAGSDQIKLLLDVFHMNIEEQNTASAIRACDSRLGHIHFADNNRLYPGQGQIDFKEILTALRAIHYQGWISLEYLPLPNELEAARAGLSYLSSIMNP